MSNKKRLNCPNCGAPITGIKCEYCGTQFLDLSVLDMVYPFYLRFKQGHHLITCKVKLEEFNVRSRTDITNNVLYAGYKPIYHPCSRNELEVELQMKSVEDENGIIYEIMEVEEEEE